MTRWATRLGLGVAGVVAIASLSACSRSSSGEASSGSGSALPAPLAPPQALPAPSLGSAPTVAASSDSVLIAEDAEEAAEQRITEQNLESELDRLEREIQAE